MTSSVGSPKPAGPTAVACHQCGAESTLADTYATERTALGRRRRYCPRCAIDKSERAARGALLWVGLLALAATVLLALGRAAASPVVSAVGWFVANLWLFVVSLAVSVLPHELGHALAAHALGLRVFSITVGVGPVVYERIAAGVRLRVHAYPFGGFTRCAFRDSRVWRLKHFLFIAAGPAVNVSFLAATLAVVRDRTVEMLVLGLAPGLMFAAANALVLVLNLLPYRMIVQSTLVPNDGLALLRTPFLAPAVLEEARAALFQLEAQSCRERGDLPAARSRLEHGLIAHPGAAVLRLELGLTLALLGECEAARSEFLAVAEAPGVNAAAQAIAWNNIAWADIVTAPNGRLEEADRLSQEALKVLGWSPALRGTRGAVLVDLGRTDEGIALLRVALSETRDELLHPMARATYAAALALGLQAKGCTAEASECLAAARASYATCPLLPRVEAALGQAAATDVKPSAPVPKKQ
jgi:tetratricopeptide (TPR) repeat protein